MRKMIIKNWRRVFVIILSSSLYAIASITSASYYGYILEHAHNKEITLFFMMIAAGITVVLLRWVFDVLNQTLMVRFVGKIIYEIREKMIASIISKQVSDFKTKELSSYTSSLLNDVELIERDSIEPFFDFISQLVIVAISSAAILYLQPVVFVVIMIGSVIVFAIPTLMSKKLQNKQSRFSAESEALTESATDILNGFSTVKSTQSTDQFLEGFKETNKHYTGAKISSGQWIMSNYATSAMLGMLVQYAAVLAAIWFIMHGVISVGIMLTMVQTMNTLVYPLIDIFRLIPQMKSAKPIIEKIKNLSVLGQSDQNSIPKLTFKKDICLTKVSLKLQGTSILNDISLTLDKNNKYLLIGDSGSGKSTLANIVSGFINNYTGKITVDGNEIANNESMFSIVSHVDQSPYLFNKTVEENIVLGKKMNHKKFEEVLKISAADLFLANKSRLKNKSTHNGDNYSGGERQRIAIARGLYQQKPLLVLDESLSGLNAKLAHRIEKDILALKDLTLLYITHKFDMSLLCSYDKIIWIKENKIYQMASPEVLLSDQEFQQFIDATGKA
ncbi:MAG: ABC transporter ATP-binding protein [Oenococcus sp.]|uniref:ATP-binding cassette domain-containing protein n=1 Tax=Oenococcus sp. TaxID=1979414 RepID=UPI0039E75418